MSEDLFDLLGEKIREQKAAAKPVPAPVVVRQSESITPYRPCTITRISKYEVLLVNDDSKHLFR